MLELRGCNALCTTGNDFHDVIQYHTIRNELCELIMKSEFESKSTATTARIDHFQEAAQPIRDRRLQVSRTETGHLLGSGNAIDDKSA